MSTVHDIVTHDVTLPGRLDAAMLERAAGVLHVGLSETARAELERCRRFVDTVVADGHEVYGATTGFGPLVTYAGRDTAAGQCDNTLQHLTAGQGADLPVPVVRATVLARLASLTRARSGVTPSVVDGLTAMLRTTFTPAVPTYGSVGASGDLVPLAYVAQALRGTGHAYVDGVRLPAAEALRAAGLTPLELDGRDALALVNGTSLTAATAGLAWRSIGRSLHTAAALSALLADVLGSTTAFLDHRLLAAFGHAAAGEVGARMTAMLDGTRPTGLRPLQEPYSVRCTPQLLGAATSAHRYAGGVVHDDLNGVSDNPLFFVDDEAVAHGGNFFGQPCSFVSDLLTTVAVQVGNLAERQLDLLVDPNRNTGLPPMLSPRPGVHHGVQGVQLASTAIVAAMRRQAVPASVQSLPTNLHNQDIVPFGTQAAQNAWETARLLRHLQGGLAVALRQAVHLRADRPTAPFCAGLADRLAEAIPPIEQDRPLDADVRLAADVVDAHVAGAGMAEPCDPGGSGDVTAAAWNQGL
ncbi:HAL/PAL/TAL family ammonia-lyase [Lentzea chajnantorensis]